MGGHGAEGHLHPLPTVIDAVGAQHEQEAGQHGAQQHRLSTLFPMAAKKATIPSTALPEVSFTELLM